MLTTKRQIRTNEDRYIQSDDGIESALNADIRLGRDSTETEQTNARPTFNVAPQAPVREEHATYDFSQFKLAQAPVVEAKKPVEEKPLYTTRDTVELPPRPEKEKRILSAEDIMPSLKTFEAVGRKAEEQQVAQSAEQAVVRNEATRRTNLTPKMKVMLVVSLAIALVLAIAVIATGVSISTATAESAELAVRITEKQAYIYEQESTLANLTSESTIREEAIARGMVDAGDNQYTAARAEKSDYPEATPHTNSFDKFCDWLAGLIN